MNFVGAVENVSDLIKINTKKNPAVMMIKCTPVERFKVFLNFIKVSKGKVETGHLGESHMKSQKVGETLFDGVEVYFYKRLMEYESRWRLLVFWAPHIH